MSDCKLALMKSVEQSLVDTLTTEQIKNVSDAMTRCLMEYSVEKLCTDVVPYDSANDKLIKQYCACLFVDGKSEKTIYQYRLSCKRLAESTGKLFTEMSAYDIRYFLACEKERGISNRSVENLRSNLSAFFQWMTREDIIQKNPCANIRPIKYEDVIRRPFSEVEIDALRSGCVTLKERALIELLLSSGARVSEVVGLDIGDIDGTTLAVRIRHGKGNKERVTYITSVAMKHIGRYLADRKEDDVALFCNGKHNRLNANGVRFILNKIAARAGVENVHPHRFRRTFATGLAARGMNVQEIQRLLGHTNINTTMQYVHLDDNKTMAAYKQYIA